MLSGIGHGYRRMREAVKFFPGQIRHIMVAPVIQEKIVQQRAAGGRAEIQFEIFAYPIG